ncbi:MAG: glutathione peroxidase [Cyanobacteria bacterium P01_F01_bin.53]
MANVSDIAVKTIDGADTTMGAYNGKVALVVNLASKCGYTKQYSGLEELYQKYKDQGFVILGFPCNDYGAQEPGTNEEIKKFATENYGATFDLFDKVSTRGAEQHPLYASLTKNADPAGDVGWNFEKFLIGKNGEIVGRFKSGVTPESAELTGAIEAQLAA